MTFFSPRCLFGVPDTQLLLSGEHSVTTLQPHGYALPSSLPVHVSAQDCEHCTGSIWEFLEEGRGAACPQMAVAGGESQVSVDWSP